MKFSKIWPYIFYSVVVISLAWWAYGNKVENEESGRGTRLDKYVMAIYSDEPSNRGIIITNALFVPNTELIAFSIYINSERRGVFLADYQGKVLRWISKGGGIDSAMPDGKYLVVGAWPDREYEQTWLFSTDGTYARRIGYNMRGDARCVPSPDGKRLYFIRSRVLAPRALVVDQSLEYFDLEDGEEKTAIGQHKIHAEKLRFFPDGEHILAESSPLKDWYSPLFKVPIQNPEGATPIIPDLREYAKNWNEDWYKEEPIYPKRSVLSGNGKWLAFSWTSMQNTVFGSKPLFVCNMETMETKRITPLELHTYPYAISYDGSRIMFEGDFPDRKERYSLILRKTGLYMVNRDGSGLRQIALDFSDIFPNKVKPLVDFTTAQERPDEVHSND